MDLLHTAQRRNLLFIAVWFNCAGPGCSFHWRRPNSILGMWPLFLDLVVHCKWFSIVQLMAVLLSAGSCADAGSCKPDKHRGRMPIPAFSLPGKNIMRFFWGSPGPHRASQEGASCWPTGQWLWKNGQNVRGPALYYRVQQAFGRRRRKGWLLQHGACHGTYCAVT